MSAKRRVLVVCDFDLLRRAIARVLGRRGHQAAQAGTAADAWDLIQADTYDAVITTYHLLDWNGLDFNRRVRAHRRGVGLVLIPPLFDPFRVAEEARNEGMVVLDTPFHPDELEAVVASAIRNAAASKTPPVPGFTPEALEPLSRRQREMVVLLATGLLPVAIARRVHRSEDTVRNHLKAAARELGVMGLKGLVKRIFKEREK
jgi:two-component system, NarL family, response regulator DesR